MSMPRTAASDSMEGGHLNGITVTDANSETKSHPAIRATTSAAEPAAAAGDHANHHANPSKQASATATSTTAEETGEATGEGQMMTQILRTTAHSALDQHGAQRDATDTHGSDEANNYLSAMAPSSSSTQATDASARTAVKKRIQRPAAPKAHPHAQAHAQAHPQHHEGEHNHQDDAALHHSQQRQDRELDECETPETTITLALGSYFDITNYVQFHIDAYQKLHPEVKINIKEINGTSTDFEQFLHQSTLEADSSSVDDASTDTSTSATADANTNTNSDAMMDADSSSLWDGAIIPSQSIGTLVEANVLLDITEFTTSAQTIRTPNPSPGSTSSTSEPGSDSTAKSSTAMSIDPEQLRNIREKLDWPDLLPYLKNNVAQYNRRSYLVPLDGDTLQLFYRPDLFQKYNQTVPRTWDEYTQVAKFFSELQAEPMLHGSCISRSSRCSNAYWTSMILATMTQAEGTETGFLIDPHEPSIRPLMGQAMMETLRHIAEQTTYGHPDESTTATCLSTNFLFNRGECAMTINWGDQLRGLENAPYPVGVTRTPGSQQAFHRPSNRLRDCTTKSCPYATYYADDNIMVNHVPYAAFGGWSAAASAQTKEAATIMDFLAFLSSSEQSMQDVLPNTRSNFLQPFRYSHLGINNDLSIGSITGAATSTNPWVAQASYDEQLIAEFTETILDISSPNLAMELRTPEALEIRSVIDAEVTSFVEYIHDTMKLNVTLDDAVFEQLRTNTTQRMERRVRDVVFTLDIQEPESPQALFNKNLFLDSYQKSLGIFVEPSQHETNIMSSFRFAGWGLAGLICGASLLCCLIAAVSSNRRVIRAWQPYTLIQCGMGFFFMGGTIALLSLDESLASAEVLDYTCMAIPWVYIVGFTLLISAVYAKIIKCRELRKARQTPSTIVVDCNATLKLTFRFLLVNVILLTIWTVTDPLLWVREEVPDDSDETPYQLGDTYGACRGEFATSYILMVILFTFNLCLCTTGIVHGFQSRRLAFEFKENHWLPLILFPYVECWIIGVPTIFLVDTDPSGTFVVMTCIITLSSMSSLLSLFAPIEWYIRKHEAEATTYTSQMTGVTKTLTTFDKEQEIMEYEKKIAMVTDDNDRIQKEIARLRNLFRDDDLHGDRGGDAKIPFRKPKVVEKPPVSQARSAIGSFREPAAAPRKSAAVGSPFFVPPVNSYNEDNTSHNNTNNDDGDGDGDGVDNNNHSADDDDDYDRLVMKDIDDYDDDENEDVPGAHGDTDWNKNDDDGDDDKGFGGSKMDTDLEQARPESYPMKMPSTELLSDAQDSAIVQPRELAYANDNTYIEQQQSDQRFPTPSLNVPLPYSKHNFDEGKDDANSDYGIDVDDDPMNVTPKSLTGLNSTINDSLSVYEDSLASTPPRGFAKDGMADDTPVSRGGVEDKGAATNELSHLTAETQESPSSSARSSHHNGGEQKDLDSVGDDMNVRTRGLLIQPLMMKSSADDGSDEDEHNLEEEEKNYDEQVESEIHDDDHDIAADDDDNNDGGEDDQPQNEYGQLKSALLSDNFSVIDATVSMLIAAFKGKSSYANATAPPDEEDEGSDDGSKGTKPSLTDQSENPATDEESGTDNTADGNGAPSDTQGDGAEEEDGVDVDVDVDEEAPKSFRDRSTTGESSAAETNFDEEPEPTAPISALTLQSANSPVTMQNAGEPSGGDKLSELKPPPLNGLQGFFDSQKNANPQHALPPLAPQPKTISFGQDVRDARSTPAGTLSAAKTQPFTLGDWSAVGTMASVLADASDSQSCSSYGSYATKDSATSMGATRAASELDTPLSKELDMLVGNKDWDGVKRAAQKFEADRVHSMNNAESNQTRSSLENRRRKKRELEALRDKISKKSAAH